MDRAASTLARKRWAKAERVNKVCLHCGRTYRGLAEQLYCSAKHQNAAAAQRLREKRRAGAERAAPAERPAPTAIGPRDEPVVAPLDRALEYTHAVAESEWAFAEGNLTEAVRWEQIAARIAADVAADTARER